MTQMSGLFYKATSNIMLTSLSTKACRVCAGWRLLLLLSVHCLFHTVIVQIFFHGFILDIVEQLCSLVLGQNVVLKTLSYAGRFLSKSKSACALIVSLYVHSL